MPPLQTKSDPIDIHVGARIRILRKHKGVNQQQLAGSCGVTFQQIQKYERGFNRVSAPMLWHIAQRLGVTPGYFFEGMSGAVTNDDQTVSPFAALAQTEDGAELALLFVDMDAVCRGSMLNIARAIGGAGQRAWVEAA